MKDYLNFYGYTNHPSCPDNKTAFFNYDSKELAQGPSIPGSLPFNGYLEHNRKALEAAGKPRETKEYVYNTPGELYNFFPGMTLLSIRHLIEHLHVD